MVIDRRSEDRVLRNLNQFILATKGRTQAGIQTALSFIENKAVVKTPVDTGNLRNSYYKKALTFKKDFPAGEIGNTAEYALYVHENLESKHTIGEARYLEKAIVENVQTIQNIIASRIKV